MDERMNTPAGEYHRVATHGCGFALGAMHERQLVKFTRMGKVAAVMKYFSGAANYWSATNIQSNVTDKYSPTGLSATVFDPLSIMLCEFAVVLFNDGKGGTNTNTWVSATDKAKMKTMYP